MRPSFAIFDTGSPYQYYPYSDDCSCTGFFCTDAEYEAGKIEHFKFERFETETEYDYLFIGSPHGGSLRISGDRETNIWVTEGDFDTNFTCYFIRKSS